ncbi:hypothetical protein C8J56DRAFT_1058875 [Mycena floridula]|nr:hypothetical protein C8J56DRAFT_1058875 [Mycena floridula]
MSTLALLPMQISRANTAFNVSFDQPPDEKLAAQLFDDAVQGLLDCLAILEDSMRKERVQSDEPCSLVDEENGIFVPSDSRHGVRDYLLSSLLMGLSKRAYGLGALDQVNVESQERAVTAAIQNGIPKLRQHYANSPLAGKLDQFLNLIEDIQTPNEEDRRQSQMLADFMEGKLRIDIFEPPYHDSDSSDFDETDSDDESVPSPVDRE